MEPKKIISAFFCAAVLLAANQLLYAQQQKGEQPKRAGKNIPKSVIMVRSGGKTQPVPQASPAPAQNTSTELDAQRAGTSR